MTEHPLTDESCDQITSPDHNDFRQALEETPTKFFYKYEDMRAAADWQLEQVIEWLNTTPYYFCPSVMAQLLQEAMRPTQENNNA